MTPEEFAKRIKAKYPQYAQIPDAELTRKMLAKFPQYRSEINTVSAAPPKWSLGDLEGRAMTMRDWLINKLPTVGGFAGGLIGGASGAETGPGAVATAAAGAAAGGGLGEDLRQSLTEHFHPEDKRMTPAEALSGIGKQALEQGGAEVTGQMAGRAVAPTLEKTIQKLYFAGNLGPQRDLEEVMPEILLQEKETPAKTVGGFLNTVSEAKKKIANEVDTALRNPVSVPVSKLNPASGIQEPLVIGAEMKDGTPFILRREFAGKYQAFMQDGRKIGDFSFVRHPNGEWHMSGASVAPEFQKKGVATSAYDALENVTGTKFTPSGSQTAAGQAFWERRAARSSANAPLRSVMKRVPLGSMEADTTPIADRISQLATAHPSDVDANPARISAIKNRVKSLYSKPRTYSWLNDRRTVLNKELNRFYSMKTPADQAQYLFQHPEFEIDKAEADAIRDIVYPAMDKAAGKPAGYFEQLQRKRGALMSIEDQTIEHAKNLEMRMKQAKGAPMTDPIRAYGSSSGHGGFTARVAALVGPPNAEKKADVQVARAFGHISQQAPVRTAVNKAAGKIGKSQIGKAVLVLPLRLLLNPAMSEPQQ